MTMTEDEVRRIVREGVRNLSRRPQIDGPDLQMFNAKRVRGLEDRAREQDTVTVPIGRYIEIEVRESHPLGHDPHVNYEIRLFSIKGAPFPTEIYSACSIGGLGVVVSCLAAGVEPPRTYRWI